MKIDLAAIGTKLKEIRKKLGFNQTEAGKASKISQRMLSDYEAGKWIPAVEYLLWISRESGVSVDDLLKPHVKLPAPVREPALTKKEKKLLDAYREAKPSIRQAVELLLKARKAPGGRG